MPLSPNHEEWLSRLERLPDAEVFLQTSLATSFNPALGEPGLMLAKYELMRRESFKRDEREVETLDVAREANNVAREANDVAREANNVALEANNVALEAKASSATSARWAKYAAIIAATIPIADKIFGMYFK